MHAAASAHAVGCAVVHFAVIRSYWPAACTAASAMTRGTGRPFTNSAALSQLNKLAVLTREKASDLRSWRTVEKSGVSRTRDTCQCLSTHSVTSKQLANHPRHSCRHGKTPHPRVAASSRHPSSKRRNAASRNAAFPNLATPHPRIPASSHENSYSHTRPHGPAAKQPKQPDRGHRNSPASPQLHEAPNPN